jgi:hypothetical protein
VTPAAASRLLHTLPDGPGDRYAGYVIMGVPFITGHVLALRHFSASSVGEGYVSLWHRSPSGYWTFYASARPEESCARYFGGVVDRNVFASIAVQWTSGRHLRVTVDDVLEWQITLAASGATRLFNAAAAHLPAPWLQAPSVLRLCGRFAHWALETGPINLTGRTPNGHLFTATPKRLWLVGSSVAALRGHDLGAMGPLPQQACLGDLRLPQRGLFVVEQMRLEPPVRRLEYRHA